MADIKVKFLEDVEVDNIHKGTENATVFKKNKVYPLSASAANHWIMRGKAVTA